MRQGEGRKKTNSKTSAKLTCYKEQCVEFRAFGYKVKFLIQEQQLSSTGVGDAKYVQSHKYSVQGVRGAVICLKNRLYFAFSSL